jgi:ATP synthase protein I
MSDRDRDQDRHAADRRNHEADLSARLRNLEEKLEDRRADARASEAITQNSVGRGAGQALKLAGEFVAGILVGAGIGWLIDFWLGTSPWALVVFLLLGFAAGVLNALRAVGLASAPESRIRRGDSGDGK